MKVRSRQDLIDDVRTAPDAAFRDAADRDQLLSVSIELPEGYYLCDEPKKPGWLHTIVEGPFQFKSQAVPMCIDPLCSGKGTGA